MLRIAGVLSIVGDVLLGFRAVPVPPVAVVQKATLSSAMDSEGVTVAPIIMASGLVLPSFDVVGGGGSSRAPPSRHQREAID